MSKFIFLLVLGLLFSCAKQGPLKFDENLLDRKALGDMPVELWLDAGAHKKDSDLSEGLKDLSLSGRNCVSAVYPKIDFEQSVPVFKSSMRHYLKCESMDLSPLSGDAYTIVIVFVPALGTTLFSARDGADVLLGIHWLNGEGVIVQNGSSAEILSQKALITLPENKIAILKFTYDRTEPLNAQRQKLWINGVEQTLSPVTTGLENSGEILSSTEALTVSASTATEISSLFLFEGGLTSEHGKKLDCYLRNRFKLDSLICN